MSLRYWNLTDDDDSGIDESDRFLDFTAIHEACSHGDSGLTSFPHFEPAQFEPA